MPVNLVLGTAQFGAAYGINNKTGRRLPDKEISDILRKAFSSGIDLLDTAQAYGESESVLGALSANAGRFNIISKFTVTPGSAPRKLLSESLSRLRTGGLYAFLYHRFSDFEVSSSWYRELIGLKSEGLFGKLGFSVYYPREIISLLDRDVAFDLVQLPYSVFDRRFEPLLPELKKRGVEVHARSLFLQGLVFRVPEELPSGLESIRPKLERLRSISEAEDIPLSVLCLCFGFLNKHLDRLVVGVDGVRDLEDAVSSMGRKAEVSRVYEELSCLQEKDESIILPVNWRK